MRSNKTVVTQVPTTRIPGGVAAERAARRAAARPGHSVPALAHAGAVSGVAAGYASLSEAVDAVAAIDSLLSSLAASRAVLVESVRVWAEDRPELFVPDDGRVPGTQVPSPAPEAPSRPDDEPADDEPAVLPEELVTRLARALRLPPDSVLALAEESRALVHEHPRTLAALRGGRITYGHAQAILGYTDGLQRGARTALETRLLKRAHTVTPAQLTLHAREERERRLRAATPHGLVAAPARRRVVLPRTEPGTGRAGVRAVGAHATPR